VERFNRYLRESFYNPLVTRLQAHVPLDVATANVEVLKWLRDVANQRIHRGLGIQPLARLPAEQVGMLPYDGSVAPALAAPGRRVARPLPVESLQHPLSVYADLLPQVPA
jgi:hypothetical protein